MWSDAAKDALSNVKSAKDDFLVRAEEISDTARELDLKTFDEVVTFVAENTFIDGQSLSVLFP